MSVIQVPARLRGWLTALGTRPRPHPRVAASAGPSLPAWSLRVLIAAIATWCAIPLLSEPLHWAVAVPTIAVMAVRGSGGAASVFAVGTGLLVLSSGPPTDSHLLLLVVGVHLAVELSALIGGVHRSARVERRILWRAAPSFLLIQLVAQSLTLFGLQAAATGVFAPALPVVSGAVLAAAAWMVIARLRSL